MSFFKFNDQKSKKQAAVATLYQTDTKKQNAENRARFYERWSLITEARVEIEDTPIIQ